MTILWLKKILGRSKQHIIPFTLSDKELTKIFHEQKVCPDCGVWDFRKGPSGGMSTNIYCANCGSWFNEQGPFGLDRIFKSDNLDLDTVDFDHSDKYELYTWDILKTWYPVAFDTDDIKKRTMLLDAFNWCCSNSEPLGRWSVKDYTMYFEKESDAVAIKLRWY